MGTDGTGLRNVDMNPASPSYSGDTDPCGAAQTFRNWLCRRVGHAGAPKNYGLAIQSAH